MASQIFAGLSFPFVMLWRAMVLLHQGLELVVDVAVLLFYAIVAQIYNNLWIIVAIWWLFSGD